jgi:hypothetical protein
MTKQSRAAAPHLVLTGLILITIGGLLVSGTATRLSGGVGLTF